MSKRKLLYIEWMDAKSEGEKGWKGMADLEGNPMLCFSIGWVLHENALAITLASSLTDDGEDYDGDVTIPKSWILNSREIRCSRFKKPKHKKVDSPTKDQKEHGEHTATK